MKTETEIKKQLERWKFNSEIADIFSEYKEVLTYQEMLECLELMVLCLFSRDYAQTIYDMEED